MSDQQDEQARRDPIIDRYVFERMSPARGMSALVHKDNANAAIVMAVREARAEGERAATERFIAMLKESSSDARELWAAKRESAAVSERWASEYWRGQMNGCDHIIVELEADAIESGEHEQR